jgi:hypothetical protein
VTLLLQGHEPRRERDLRRAAPSPPRTERSRECIATGRISTLDLLPNPNRDHRPSRREIDQQRQSPHLAGMPRERSAGSFFGTGSRSGSSDPELVVTVARGVSFVHLLPHRGRGVRRRAFSDDVFPGKRTSLGEQVCWATYHRPFSDRPRLSWRGGFAASPDRPAAPLSGGPPRPRPRLWRPRA